MSMFSFQKFQMEIKKRIDIEYLSDLGFTPINETGDTITYNFKKNDTYIGFEHHNWNVKSDECYPDWWILMIKSGQLLLKCECNYTDMFENILKTFDLYIK